MTSPYSHLYGQGGYWQPGRPTPWWGGSRKTDSAFWVRWQRGGPFSIGELRRERASLTCYSDLRILWDYKLLGVTVGVTTEFYSLALTLCSASQAPPSLSLSQFGSLPKFLLHSSAASPGVCPSPHMATPDFSLSLFPPCGRPRPGIHTFLCQGSSDLVVHLLCVSPFPFLKH